MSKYIKDSIDFQSDSGKYVLLKPTSIFYENIKDILSENELIESYVSAVKCLANYIKGRLKPNISILDSSMPTTPFLFLCRHTIEIIIKRKLELNNIDIMNIHLLKDLWDILSQSCKEDLSSYNELILTFDKMDYNGQCFRYAKDTKGQYFENKPKFIDVIQIYNDILLLKKTLLEN